MKATAAIVTKDLVLLSRDKMGLFFVVVFPVLFGLFTGVVFSGLTQELPEMIIGVVDEDQSDYSGRFIQGMKEMKGARPLETTRDLADTLIRTGQLGGFIQIPKGFGQEAGKVSTNPPTIYMEVDPANMAGDERLKAVIYGVMMSLADQRYQESAASGLAGLFGVRDENARMDLINIEIVQPIDRGAVDQWDALVAGATSPFEISFPLAMVWAIVGCSASFAASLVREKESGTFMRLRSAPIRTWEVLFGKGLAMFITVAVILGLLVVLGTFMGVTVTDPAKMAVVILALGYTFVGIMTLLSVFGRTQQAVESATWSILLVLTMFGGGMVPFEFLPDWMQSIGAVSPFKWSIIAIEGALWRQLSYEQMLKPLAMLLGVGTVCLIVGCTVFQRPNRG